MKDGVAFEHLLGLLNLPSPVDFTDTVRALQVQLLSGAIVMCVLFCGGGMTDTFALSAAAYHTRPADHEPFTRVGRVVVW